MSISGFQSIVFEQELSNSVEIYRRSESVTGRPDSPFSDRGIEIVENVLQRDLNIFPRSMISRICDLRNEIVFQKRDLESSIKEKEGLKGYSKQIVKRRAKLAEKIQTITGEITDLEVKLTKLERESSKRDKSIKSQKECVSDMEQALNSGRVRLHPSEVREYCRNTVPFRINENIPFSKTRTLDESRKKALFEMRPFREIFSSPYRIDPKSLLVNPEAYLKSRISDTFIELIKKHPDCVEFFLGTPSEMRYFYENVLHYDFVCAFPSMSSTNFLLYAKQSSGEPILSIVIQGFDSYEKLYHRGLQLEAAGLDLDRMNVLGNGFHYVDREVDYFTDKLDWGRGRTPRVLFIGNSRLTLNEVGYVAHPEVARADQNGYAALNTRYARGGFVSLELQKITLEDPKDHIKVEMVVGAMRMPNGSLAGSVVKKILNNHRIDYLVMNGAGGSLVPNGKIGSYQQITESIYYRDRVNLSTVRDQVVIFQHRHYLSTAQRVNVTVSSLLEEDEIWMEQALDRDATSVDVESYHILKAFVEESHPESKIIPGVFISDLLRSKSLEGKIGAKNAYQNIRAFTKDVLQYISFDIARKINGK